MGKRRDICRDLVGKLEGQRLLEEPRRRWGDNMTMYLQEVFWRAWTGLIWLRIWTGGGPL
jgi:hypothetical protein